MDVAALSPYPQRWLILGPQLALRPGDPVVTYCSRHLEPLRGLPTFLRAVAALQRRHRTVQVIVVGENSPGYSPACQHPGGYLGAMLEELRGQLDLERLHIVGHVPHQQLIGIFQISAAHVYLTYPYALSWSMLEAMACGAPVVGSRGAPVEEVIHSEQNGLLVDFNNPQHLCETLLRLLDDPALRQRLGAAGRRTVEQRYALDACTSAYESLLKGESIAGASR